MFEQIVELGLEGGIGLGRAIFALEIEDQRHQRLGDEAAAELAEMPALVGQVSQRIGQGNGIGHALSFGNWVRGADVRRRAISAIDFRGRRQKRYGSALRHRFKESGDLVHILDARRGLDARRDIDQWRR
jgi:hypothetical protein